MAKKFAFAKGLATGVVATAATVAGAVFAIKKTLLIYEEEKAAFIQENRKSSPQTCFSLIAEKSIKNAMS